MALSFEAFLYGIQKIESGGDYNALGPRTKNGDYAYGKYQIMGDNIGPWSKKYLGRTVSIGEFRNSPEIQEALARAVLKAYYNKYGADGAAAMWFSGQPNPNSSKSDGYNTVKQYVAKMNAAARGYTGQSSTPGGGGGSGGGPTIDEDVLASQYGLTNFIINYYPELKKLFRQAVSESWTPDKFKAKLEASDWWRTRSKTEREWIIFNNSDPASAEQKWIQEQHRLNQLLAQWGIPGTMDENKALLEQMVWGVIINGWTDSQVRYQANAYLDFQKEGVLAGEAGQFQMKLAELAYVNGVELDPEWYKLWYRGIMRGNATQEQAMRDIRNRAAAMFAGFKDQILAGQNVIDLASPYLTSMAQLLEIAPGDIDLYSTEIKKALNFKDKNGVLGSMPLWQFQNELRKDPRWLQTNNAREGIMSVAHQVARDFGVGY